MLSEGLRLGAAPFTARYCTKPWRIPDDGFIVPKDMKVLIPIVTNTKIQISTQFLSQGWASLWWKVLGGTFQVWSWTLQSREQRENPWSCLSTFWIWCQVGIEVLHFIGSLVYRACLGQNLFKMETKIMLTQLLRNFRWIECFILFKYQWLISSFFLTPKC